MGDVPNERECMMLRIGLTSEHEKMLDAIIAGVPITSARPGNAAIGAALRCASRIAAESSRGATSIEFVHADGRRQCVPIASLW